MTDFSKRKELHSIKKFRGSNFGILRLNQIAKPNSIEIHIGEEKVKPIGFDTYGHPIISEESFTYYKALKALKERSGESLVPEVEYEPKVFCVRRDVYDSKVGIEKIGTFPEKEQLKELKRILVYRKLASFNKEELNTYILYGEYALYSDGRVYMCTYDEIDKSRPNKMVMELSEVSNFKLLNEVHIPNENDTCAICGDKFNINDIKNCLTTEDENSQKNHTRCLYNYVEAVNYEKASRIIDTVYLERPSSEIIKEYDEEDKKEKVWFVYHTQDGDVGVRFKNKVIEIKWFGNFKPFNLETLFKDEDVTKRKLKDAKIIHAWSPSDAIKYLMMVEKT